MARRLLSINRSPIRSPILAPIHSALSGNARANTLQIAVVTVQGGAPVFGVIVNTYTSPAPEYFLEATRRFRTRQVEISTDPSGPYPYSNGSLTDTHEDVTLYPTTSRSGLAFTLDGASDVSDYFNYRKFNATGSGSDFPGLYSGETVTSSGATNYAWNYDNGAGTITYATESRTDEYSYADPIGKMIDWLATVNWSAVNGVWSPSPASPTYATMRLYNGGGTGSSPATTFLKSDGISTIENLFDISVATFGSDMASFGAMDFDGEVYRNGSGLATPTTYLANTSNFPDYVVLGSSVGVPLTIPFSGPSSVSIQCSQSQVKFDFATDYFIFEASHNTGSPGNTAGTLVKFISSGTAAAGDIINLPPSSFAESLPAISNSTFVPRIQTCICFSGQTWSDFLATTWTNVTEISNW